MRRWVDVGTLRLADCEAQRVVDRARVDVVIVYQTGEDGQSGGDGGGLCDSGAGEEGVEVSKFTESFWEWMVNFVLIGFQLSIKMFLLISVAASMVLIIILGSFN